MALKRDTFRDIDDRTDELRDMAGEYPDIWAEFVQQFNLSWIYHENALEGIVLTHAEISSALKGRPIAPETYGDVRGLKLAMELVRKEATNGASRVDMALLRRIHATLGSTDAGFQPAKYRKDIPLHRAYFHDIAQPQLIPNKIAKLLDWAAENDPEDEDAIRFAAQFHHEYMGIFPFADHTGKTGRLALNYLLVRHGYLPVIFHATERQRYYDTLRQPKREMESLLNDMMSNCVENGVKFMERKLAERKKARVRELHAS